MKPGLIDLGPACRPPSSGDDDRIECNARQLHQGVFMNTKQQAAQAIVNFLASNDRVLFLNGTNQHQKHALALQAAITRYPAPATLLFRANSIEMADTFLRAVLTAKKPKPGEVMSIGGQSLYVDTINEKTWIKSPRAVDVAIVYPLESLQTDAGVACVHDFLQRGAKKIILVTCTNVKDFAWIEQFDPKRITYDAEAENPAAHTAMKAVERENFRVDKPSNLPAYAASTAPEFLIRLHCDHCNAGRWAKLNKSYPGLETITNAGAGEYTATCLKCGTEADDNYNWYGQ